MPKMVEPNDSDVTEMPGPIIGLDARAIGRYPGLGRYAVSLLEALALREDPWTYRIIVEMGQWKEVEAACASFLADPRFAWHPVPFPLLTPRNFQNGPWREATEGLSLFHALFQVGPAPRGLPLIATVHDLMDLLYADAFSHHPGFKAWLLKAYFTYGVRRTIRRATRLIAVSESTCADLIKVFPECHRKVEVIHEAAGAHFFEEVPARQLEEVREKYHLPPHFLLSLGSTKRYKNLSGLIHGYNTFRDKGGEALPLVLAGLKEVPDPDLEQCFQESPWREDIVRLGPVEEDDLPAIYRFATVFCFVSLWEGFGLPALEAMACGTPLLASHSSAIGEVAGTGGRQVDPLDPADIAAGLREMLASPETLAAWAERARSRAGAFSWTKAAQQTADLYRCLLEEAG